MKLSKKYMLEYWNHPLYIKDAAEWSRKTHLQRVSWIRMNGLDQAENVLELGCGVGLQCSLFKNWVGLDIARKCKPTIIADACQLPFKDNSFEAVMGINFIEHMEDKEKLIAECVRVAKKTVKFLSPVRDEKGGYPKKPDFKKLLKEKQFGGDADACGFKPCEVWQIIEHKFGEKAKSLGKQV